jgi:AraC family transcriptional regulator, arabinose operon regulatory protein
VISRRVTPYTSATSLFGDEFFKDRTYSNWRPNGSGDWLLIYTANGSGAIGTPGKTVLTRPGDLLLYEPQAAQDYRTAPEGRRRWHLLWAHFLPRPAWHLWLQWPEIAPRIRLVHLRATQRGPCEEAWRRMIRATHRAGVIQTDLGMAALEEVILHGRAAQAEEENPPTDPRIGRAAVWLTDRFKEPFHLPTLARQCGLSVSRFSHLFRDRMGLTPGQFLERQRLSHAAHLLRLTSLTVGEISAECGFENPFFFTNRFRRHYGVSPTAFRQRAGRNRTLQASR